MTQTVDDYTAAVREATTRQGLDPLVRRLTEEGYSFDVRQTGGFTMVVYVDVNAHEEYGITNDNGGTDRDAWLIMSYSKQLRDAGLEDEGRDVASRLPGLDQVMNVLGTTRY